MVGKGDPLAEAFSRRKAGLSFDHEVDQRLQAEGLRALERHRPRKQSMINTHTVFWMVSSFVVFYYTDFANTVRFEQTVKRHWLYLGGISLACATCIALFLIVYYHYYKGIDDYEKHQPYAVPVATILFVVAASCLCVALWPVWSVFTPVVLGVQAMGLVFLLSVLPL